MRQQLTYEIKIRYIKIQKILLKKKANQNKNEGYKTTTNKQYLPNSQKNY